MSETVTEEVVASVRAYASAASAQRGSFIASMPYREMLDICDAFAAARREVETVTRERDAARVALEDVRRVETWLWALQADDRRTVRYSCGEYEARDYDGEYVAGAQSLTALGRSLAQEAGDGQ